MNEKIRKVNGENSGSPNVTCGRNDKKSNAEQRNKSKKATRSLSAGTLSKNLNARRMPMMRRMPNRQILMIYVHPRKLLGHLLSDLRR